MKKCICDFMSSLKEIEHSSENMVIFIFLDFLCSHCFSILTLYIVFFFFSPFVFVFVFANLLAMLSFSKKLCNSKK